MRYEYKLVPAPKRPGKIKGVKAGEDRLAAHIESLMNELGRDGWAYLRADTLPSEERQGLTSRNTVFHTILVFQRPLTPEGAEIAPLAPSDAPEAPADTPAPSQEPPVTEPSDPPAESDTTPPEEEIDESLYKPSMTPLFARRD